MSSFCCQFTWPRTCIFVLLILYKFTISTSQSSVSYSKQCGSVVPEATPTTYAEIDFPCLQTLTSFITGGERILGKNSSHTSLTFFGFHSSRNIYATDLHGVYKVDAELIFRVYNKNMYHAASNSTYGRSSGHPRMPARLMFLLQGYWSESSGKGCFVGSAPWYSSEAILRLDMTHHLIAGPLYSPLAFEATSHHAARDYVERIEEFVGVPVYYIGIGPGCDALIYK
ncbi:hypothetical protein POM88_043532 [Heracleum sosnowskyi]|uniref:DUF2921 domain-containing protein n=1 Tax=Heracleum sosnowskyi TaxID=360622 RepID=A0AAD8M4K3_9APIA|nr:hypothetical protein POM88_043532 [Heracleum sosnowskyi]